MSMARTPCIYIHSGAFCFESAPPPFFLGFLIEKTLPSQISEISMANSRQNIRKLVKDGFVIRQPHKVIARLSPENLIIDVLAWGPAFVKASKSLVATSLLITFQLQIHSRARTLRGLAAKRLGRHTGHGAWHKHFLLPCSHLLCASFS